MVYIIGMLLLILTLPGTFELLLVTLGALLPIPKHKKILELLPKRLAVLIPAHNEALGIKNTIASLKACSGSADCIVIADNCTDQTADCAAEAGARVLVRRDPLHRGKPYALAFAFERLREENYEAFLIIDADTHVEANLLQEVASALSFGADAVQVKYVLDAEDKSMRSTLLRIAFTAFNVIRARGRSRLSLSAGLFGNGFALSQRLLEAVPFTLTSLVEDLAYHIKVVKAGYLVDFIEQATVRSVIPPSSQGRVSQRKRWEGGRLRMLLDKAPHLFAKVFTGHWRLIEPLLDLLLLPLGYHCLLLLLLIPFHPWFALISLGIVGLHVCLAAHQAEGGWKNYLSLMAAPGYLVWKLMHIGAVFLGVKRSQTWERTQRKEEQE